MKKRIISLLIGFPLCLIAQIELSGFFDILYQRDISNRDNIGFNYGQFEVDISSPISKYIHIESALVYNPNTQTIEMGAGFIDFHLLGKNDGHPIRGKFLTHSGILLGRFDIPFGIDYLSIPSPEREVVTIPLVNEMTINSWNDFGLNFYGADENFNIVLFTANGFNGGVAFGGRTGILMIPNTEFGFSYMADIENPAQVHNRVLGMDFQSRLGSNKIKFEYYFSNGVYMGKQDEDHTNNRKHGGYYVQYLKDFENWLKMPFFSVIRYGEWSAEFDADDNANYRNRKTLGIGYRVSESVEFKLEHCLNQIGKENRHDQFTLQTVISFRD